MSTIDYGINAEDPLDAIACMLDNGQTATFIMKELEELGFKIVRAEEIDRLRALAGAVTPGPSARQIIRERVARLVGE